MVMFLVTSGLHQSGIQVFLTQSSFLTGVSQMHLHHHGVSVSEGSSCEVRNDGLVAATVVVTPINDASAQIQ